MPNGCPLPISPCSRLFEERRQKHVSRPQKSWLYNVLCSGMTASTNVAQPWETLVNTTSGTKAGKDTGWLDESDNTMTANRNVKFQTCEWHLKWWVDGQNFLFHANVISSTVRTTLRFTCKPLATAGEDTTRFIYFFSSLNHIQTASPHFKAKLPKQFFSESSDPWKSAFIQKES